MADQMHDRPEPVRVLEARRRHAGNESANIAVSQRAFRQRHRLTRTRSVTKCPWAGRSFKVRQ
jgi:hypothetical protein